MEEKKELVKNVLIKLRWSWDLADNMLALVESEYCTESLLDELIGLLNDSLQNVKNANEEVIFKNALETIQKLKQKEEIK